MSRIRVITLLWILTKLSLILSLNFRPKNFKLEAFEYCPDSEDLPARFKDVNITMPEINLYLMNGFIEVKQNITVPVGLTIFVKRCSLDRTHCEDYDRMTITKICHKLRDSKAIWAPLISKVDPAPHCPVQNGMYTMTNATANLSVVSRLPLEGFRYNVKFHVHQDGKPSVLLMCMIVDVAITAQKRRQN